MWTGKSQVPCSQRLILHILTSSDLVPKWAETNCDKVLGVGGGGFTHKTRVRHLLLQHAYDMLIPNVPCGHNIGTNNALWPLGHRTIWFMDCFNYSSCSCLCVLCPIMNIVSCVGLFSIMGVCYEPIYSKTSLRTEKKLHDIQMQNILNIYYCRGLRFLIWRRLEWR